MSKPILVTGGAGFIGSHTVVELASAGFEPIIVDDLRNSSKNVLLGIKEILGREITFYKEDCNNFEVIKEIVDAHRVEGIIHFAAYKAVGESVEMPIKYYRNNIGSLLNILEVMQASNVSNLVFSSSCTVYGQPNYIPVTEDTPIGGAKSPYGNTKVVCENILESVVQSGAPLNLISLRYFNPIGAHESGAIGELPHGVPNNLVPFVTQTAIGKRAKLVVFGNDYQTEDGTNVRDFIHVVDLAKAHVSALNLLGTKGGNFYDTFNVGTGVGASVLDVIRSFESVNQIKLNYEIGPRRLGDVEQIYSNVDKAWEKLKWRAEKSLEECLIDAWRWEKKLKNRE